MSIFNLLLYAVMRVCFKIIYIIIETFILI